jgi:chloramphenicol-sensitive protein RarD
MNKGIWSGIAAYSMWGFFPIYWKLLQQVPALQLLGHRIGWSFILLTAYIVAAGQWQAFRSTAFKPKTVGIYAVAGVLLSVNWLIYVWGVNAGFIIETSLGYFINPILNVVMGYLFLGERFTTALAQRVTYYTTIAGARAAVEGMRHLQQLDVYSLQELHATL